MNAILRRFAPLSLIAGVAFAATAAAQTPMPHDRVRLKLENLAHYYRVIECGYSPPVERRPVAGIITAVRHEFAEISIGSDDGVRVGQRLELRRDGRLRGGLIVRRVDPDRSVVEVERGFRRPEMEPGDFVASPVKPPDSVLVP